MKGGRRVVGSRRRKAERHENYLNIYAFLNSLLSV